MFTGRELHNLLLESVGLAGARRVDPLEVIQSLKIAAKQERRRAYCRNRSARDPSYHSSNIIFNSFSLLVFPDSNSWL